MHTHLNPAPENFEARAQLDAICSRLREVHASLVASVRLGFEKLYGRVDGAGTLLELVLYDPLFAWLRPLSALMAELDALADDKADTVDVLKLIEVRKAIERWIGSSGERTEFSDSYRAYLQSDPNVVMAHAALKQELAAIAAA